MAVTVRQRLKRTAPSVATATGLMSVVCVSVTLVVWVHDVSVQWMTTVHRMMLTASQSQGPQSAAVEATVCVDSAPAIQTSLVRCGANTANVTTSTACASKGNCVLVSRSILSVVISVSSLSCFASTNITFCYSAMDLKAMRHEVLLFNFF